MTRRQDGPFRRTQGSAVEIPPPEGVDGWRLVENEAGFSALVEELAAEPAYAIDTEFHRERTYYPHLALVQIGWASGIALVDPLVVDVAPLGGLFERGALAVLHAADQDLEVLERACGRTPVHIFDTQVSAGFLGYSSPSLLTLTEAILGLRLHKADQLADWVHRPLSQSQQAYAAGDVAHLLRLQNVIAGRLASLGRTEWAAEECAILLEKNRSSTVPDEAWWRLPHSRQLRGASRAVAQEVAAWRERRAQRQDLPVRFVLSDLALLSVAQRPPTHRDELLRIRGVDHRHLGGGAGDELLVAVAAGKSLPPSRLRLPLGGPAERPNRPVIALATAYVQQRSSDLELDPAVLATRADLAAFFQRKPVGRLTSGWRYELIGAELERLATGSASLAFDGRGSLVLEERSLGATAPGSDRGRRGSGAPAC